MCCCVPGSHFSEVQSQPSFLALPSEKLVDLLSSSKLEVAGEEEVFKAALKWMKEDPDSRSGNFHQVRMLNCGDSKTVISHP